MYKTAFSIAFLIFIFCADATIAKGSQPKEQQSPLGKSMTKTYPLDGVTQISISAFYEVVLEYGTENTYSIAADSVIHQYIQLNQQDNQLSIKTAPTGKTMEKNLKAEQVPPVQRIVIRTNQLEQLRLNAVANFKSNDAYVSDNFNLEASAVSKIDLNIDCKQFNLNVKACSSVKISGQSENSTISSHSVSNFSIKDLESAKVTLEANACSLIDVSAKEEMEINASNISKLVYHGSFKITKENLKNIGSLTRIINTSHPQNKKGEHLLSFSVYIR